MTSVPTITTLTPHITFDPEQLALDYGLTLLPQEKQKLHNLWQLWFLQLQAKKIYAVKKSWLALWLSQKVEKEVTSLWQQSPYEGYLAHCLATEMIMTAAKKLIPQVVKYACAPMPYPHPALNLAIKNLGLFQKHTQNIARTFALTTHMPWIGGCEVCHLAPCPKQVK